MAIMSETQISAMTLHKEKDDFSSDDTITINVRFSLTGGLRDSFTEENWTGLLMVIQYTLLLVLDLTSGLKKELDLKVSILGSQELEISRKRKRVC